MYQTKLFKFYGQHTYTAPQVGFCKIFSPRRTIRETSFSFSKNKNKKVKNHINISQVLLKLKTNANFGLFSKFQHPYLFLFPQEVPNVKKKTFVSWSKMLTLLYDN